MTLGPSVWSKTLFFSGKAAIAREFAFASDKQLERRLPQTTIYFV